MFSGFYMAYVSSLYRGGHQRLLLRLLEASEITTLPTLSSTARRSNENQQLRQVMRPPRCVQNSCRRTGESCGYSDLHAVFVQAVNDLGFPYSDSARAGQPAASEISARARYTLRLLDFGMDFRNCARRPSISREGSDTGSETNDETTQTEFRASFLGRLTTVVDDQHETIFAVRYEQVYLHPSRHHVYFESKPPAAAAQPAEFHLLPINHYLSLRANAKSAQIRGLPMPPPPCDRFRQSKLLRCNDETKVSPHGDVGAVRGDFRKRSFS